MALNAFNKFLLFINLTDLFMLYIIWFMDIFPELKYDEFAKQVN